MNLPNMLTLSRILLAIVFVAVVSRGGIIAAILATVIFALASLTDFYDGYYAKKYHLTTNFGKMMDPIADKFLILSAFLVFLWMRLITPWMFYAIFVREILVTAYRLLAMTKGKFLAAEWAGKYKTVLQMSSVFVILIFLMVKDAGLFFHDRDLRNIWLGGIEILMQLTVVLTIVSGLSYLWNNRYALSTQKGK